MIYPDVPVDEWSKTTGVASQYDESCPSCGSEFPIGTPIRLKGYAGFEFRCRCGGAYSATTVCVPFSDETKAFWREILAANTGKAGD